jgi:hypothetical protein
METSKVPELLANVRARVAGKTNIQDVTEPLTGQIDRRRLAKKFTDLEHAVDDLADAVEEMHHGFAG